MSEEERNPWSPYRLYYRGPCTGSYDLLTRKSSKILRFLTWCTFLLFFYFPSNFCTKSKSKHTTKFNVVVWFSAIQKFLWSKLLGHTTYYAISILWNQNENFVEIILFFILPKIGSKIDLYLTQGWLKVWPILFTPVVITSDWSWAYPNRSEHHSTAHVFHVVTELFVV